MGPATPPATYTPCRARLVACLHLTASIQDAPNSAACLLSHLGFPKNATAGWFFGWGGDSWWNGKIAKKGVLQSWTTFSLRHF